MSTKARSLGEVKARAGLGVLPDRRLATCPKPDILLIPGGVVDDELHDAEFIDWVAEGATPAAVTSSVCTGALIPARAGLLAGRRATTHWEDIADLQAGFPDVDVVDGARWIDEGSVIASAGIAAGIDMSLHLVARFAGDDLAAATARQMDHPHSRDAWRRYPVRCSLARSRA